MKTLRIKSKYTKHIIISLYLGLILILGATLLPASLHAQIMGNSCSISEDQEEILWFARAVFSETKETDEMVLIAWVIRNRVDDAYRGDDTYFSVVTRAGQFSGLNEYDKQYRTNTSLSFGDENPTWQKAIRIAEAVYYAPSNAGPIPKSVKHFYSPKSMAQTPKWADDEKLYHTIEGGNDKPARFAFYAGVR